MKEIAFSCSDLSKHRIIVEKSTVPLGTHKQVKNILQESFRTMKGISINIDDFFTIVSIPEFLAEGMAIKNLTEPDRIVIGTPKNRNG